ncbi:MAG: hypothetical protein ABIQ16_10420, partial [Polyangiaceae bacterium]
MGIPLSDGLPATAQIATNGDGPTLATLTQPDGSAQFRFIGTTGRLRASQALAEGVAGTVVTAGNGSDFLAVMTNSAAQFTTPTCG